MQMYESKLNPDLSDISKALEVMDIFTLLKISAGYFK